MSIFGTLTLPGPVKLKTPLQTVAVAALRDASIIAMWCQKVDTYDISRKLMLRQSLVANRLAAIRDGRAA